MSSTIPSDLNDVLDFVQESGGRFLSSSCEIRQSVEGGLGVFAKRNIEPGTTLLRIPKQSVFTANNSSISNLLFESEIDGILGLNIAFVYEVFVFGDRSHWSKYLKSIKHKNEDNLYLPPAYLSDGIKLSLKETALDIVFDGLEEQEEVQEGFEIAYELSHHWHLESNITIPYIFDFEPEDSERANAMFKEFAAIAFAISSRVFELDNFHGFGLVPIADLFNHHSSHPNVRFESTYNVCDKCGEFGDCSHVLAEMKLLETQMAKLPKKKARTGLIDQSLIQKLESASDPNTQIEGTHEADSNYGDKARDHNDENTALSINQLNPEDCVDIVLVTSIQQGAEIFNSYGDHSNSYLLAKYGFCVKDNPFDIVDLSKQLLQFGRQNRKVLGPRFEWWQKEGYVIFREWYELFRKELDEEDISSSENEEDEEINTATSDSRHISESENLEEGNSLDSVDEELNPWYGIHIDRFGKPSEVLSAILNLLSISKKNFSDLISDGKDKSTTFRRLCTLNNSSSTSHKKLLRQICLLKKYSFKPEALSMVTNSNERYILEQISTLINEEKKILHVVLGGS